MRGISSMNLRNLATIYLLSGNQILLIYRVGSRTFSKNLWCGIGGHFEPCEMNAPQEYVMRELREETAIKPDKIRNLRLKYITTRLKDEEIRQQYIYFADMPHPAADFPICEEGSVTWVPFENLPKLEMSFTNQQCLEHYFSVGSDAAFVYAGAVGRRDGLPCINFTPLQNIQDSY